MTSTSQDTPAKEAEGSSPTTQAPEATKEARQVPLDALVAVRQEAQALKQRLAEMEAELARKANPTQPAAAAQPQSEVEKLAKSLEEIQRKERVRDVSAELGIDDKQAAYVAELQSKYSDLTPTEALELAAKRKPDLFAERGQPGFDPRIHGTMRPRPGTPPPPKPSDRQQRLDRIKTSTGVDKDKLLNNYVGGIAAQAMGWGDIHKKIPI
jgi:cell division septum initiation protein DivIVA